MFLDKDFPRLLGAELYRPDPAYFMKGIVRPVVAWDFMKAPGDSVQLDRYQYWNDINSFTLESRERGETETIGTLNSRDIPKDKVIMTLKEYTGPSAGGNTPDQASTFKIPVKTLMTAQRNLYDSGNARAFHDWIGSMTLLRDFRRWEDRVYIQKLLETPNTYNPSDVADGGVYPVGPQQFAIKRDLLTIVERLQKDNVPTFEDGNYACACSPRFWKHLRQDPDFREVARYPGALPVQAMVPGNYGVAPAQIPFMNNPNALILGGSNLGQAQSSNGMAVMPTGVVFEGVRFFMSNNLPTQRVQMTYTALAPGQDGVKNPIGPGIRDANLGIFFGPQAIGVGVCGAGPEVLLNNNDDFSRFIIAIWRMYGAFALLNENFVQVARTYGD